jgi:hypothetical protein
MKKLILSIFVLGVSLNGFSYKHISDITNGGDTHGGGDDRAAGCAAPTDKIFLEYNNVKALIETGGLMWQDRASGASAYTVPKEQNVSVIYSGALWMGGEDINGQLKMAAQRFGVGRDFWTGPLSAFGGNPGNYDPSVQQTADLDVIRGYGDAEIIPEECDKYDNFFTVRKTEIVQYIAWWNCTYNPDTDPADCELVEEIDAEVLTRIMNWPAHGDVSLGQDYYLAPFYDNPNAPAGANGFYDPINDGDYPWYDINKDVDCKNDRRVTLFGDETNWWVFNDKGNVHTETGGDPIGMEVRAQAFTFATNDAINDMTFYNYELINRGTQTLYNTYFAQYVDADIGGATDDYVGCDVSRGLGFAYNGALIDEGTGGATWGLNPPAVGIDFFEGPYQDQDDIDNPLTNVTDAIDSLGIPYEGLGLGYGDGVVDNERMGMRRFFYYNNAGGLQGDPSTAAQHYGFMQGLWGTSGVEQTYGGNGSSGSIAANYMFPGDSDPLGWSTGGIVTDGIWSEVTEGNTAADRRFCQVAGPFTLKPGAVNNLTVGVVYGRSFDGDLEASVRAMKRADTKAQALFDACFEIVEPPLAPVLSIQEMENELILFLSNPPGPDILEEYQEKDEVNIPKGEDTDGDGINDVIFDQFYRFQGYQIYQMIDENASIGDVNDITKARLVAQCDIEDGVSKLVNYIYNEEDDITEPEVKVVGADEGLKHSFHITEDKFATGNRDLVNHKKYYFIAVSYGYNSFKEFDPTDAQLLDGQQLPYLVSRQGPNGGSIASVLGIPHHPAPEADGTTFGTYYGWSPKITQTDGIGNGGRFVKFDSLTEATIVSDNFIAEPVYDNDGGPINVKVIDPLNVQQGDYTLGFRNDADTEKEGIAPDEDWYIVRSFEGINDTVFSDYMIGTANEQLIPEWGLSVEIKQINYTNTNGGSATYETNPIDATIEYADSSLMWLSQVTDNDQSYPFNWIRSGTNDYDSTDDACSKELWIQNPCYYNDRYDEEQLYEGLLNGGIAPFRFVGSGVYGMPIGSAGHTYGTILSSGPWNVSSTQTAAKIIDLHDVDIVVTEDKSKWTRCVVFEINDNEDQTEKTTDGQDVDVLELRGHASVDKDGVADGTGDGMGYFPGYAIDVTTGQRLNMAFSENSWLAGENGKDMIWNPTSRLVDNVGNPLFGGMHYVYVFGANNDMPVYDQGAYIYSQLNQNATGSANTRYKDVFENCQWIWEPMLEINHTLLETDVKISVRINKPYAENENTPGINNGRPMYKFTIDENSRVDIGNNTELTSALDMINIVPNPYYAYNSYETDKLDTRVKVTNLPERCTITIFNVQGALVRQYVKDDPLTSLDWDLKNHRGIPIAGGVYIIHVDVPGTGEKIIKWYGALRAPDLDNL